ncbi:hypothetical protein V1505DRAFT_367911 [Lipomyces doorenjongii]
MSPFVNMAAFLDLACARRGDDGDDNRFWKRRKLSGYRPSQQDRIVGVEYSLHVLESLGLIQVDGDGPLFPPGKITIAALSRQAYCDQYISPSRGQFGSVRDKTPEAWLVGFRPEVPTPSVQASGD